MIFIAGENLIDFISENKKYKAFAGGSSLNTAVALGKLKSDVYFFSRISNDFFGKMLFEYLKKNNVNLSLVQKTNDQSTLAIVSNKVKPEFNIYLNKTASINLKNYKFKKKFLKD